MLDFNQLQTELEALDKQFLGLMIFNLLKKGKLDYIDLSLRYVSYLESEKRDASHLTADLAYSLMHHRHPELVGGETEQEKQDFINEKALSALHRTRLFPENAKL